ncbi:MAG TPA: hypothetical protein DHU72_07355 [Rikenellaceae bacterium]|nr:hypothetical protein [Rikenellaceae bacterium]
MEQKNTIDILRETIRSWDRGRIFFIDDFATVPSQWGVRFGLSRLAEEGMILRLARGIYCYPKIEGEYSLKAVIPEAETIAYALAAKDRFRVIPYGDQAAYKLGLTGIRVSDLKYLTDGAPRHICLSKGRKIYFNHTSEVRMFDYCNETMQLVSSAIRTLGEDMIDAEKTRIIHEHLRTVPESDFLKDITLPPAWVQKIILDIWNN